MNEHTAQTVTRLLERLVAEVDGLKAEMTQKDGLTLLKTRVDAVAQLVDDLDTRVDRLGERVDRLEAKTRERRQAADEP